MDNELTEKREVESVSSGTNRAQSDAQETYEVPNGGTEAWLTVLGSALITMCGLGYFNAYGVYQDYYVREFITTMKPSDIAWIGSVQQAIQFFLAMPVGMAFDAGYFHSLMITGSLIYCFCLFMISLATPNHFYQVFLAQGIGLGVGQALTFLPAISGSIGGIVFPIMINRLTKSHGFPTAVRASAGLVTGLMVIANCIMKPRFPPKTIAAAPIKRLTVTDLVKDLPYMLNVLSGVLTVLGIFYPIFFYQLYAASQGVSENVTLYIVTIMNAGGAIGRLIPNFLADIYGPYNVTIPVILVCAIVTFIILGLHQLGGIIVIGLLYGAMNGAYVSLVPALLVNLANHPSEIGLRIGGWFSVVAIAALVGQPISGALLTDDLLWTRPTIFAGVTCAAGGCTLILSRYTFLRRAKESQFARA